MLTKSVPVGKLAKPVHPPYRIPKKEMVAPPPVLLEPSPIPTVGDASGPAEPPTGRNHRREDRIHQMRLLLRAEEIDIDELRNEMIRMDTTNGQ